MSSFSSSVLLRPSSSSPAFDLQESSTSSSSPAPSSTSSSLEIIPQTSNAIISQSAPRSSLLATSAIVTTTLTNTPFLAPRTTQKTSTRSLLSTATETGIGSTNQTLLKVDTNQNTVLGLPSNVVIIGGCVAGGVILVAVIALALFIRSTRRDIKPSYNYSKNYGGNDMSRRPLSTVSNVSADPFRRGKSNTITESVNGQNRYVYPTKSQYAPYPGPQPQYKQPPSQYPMNPPMHYVQPLPMAYTTFVPYNTVSLPRSEGSVGSQRTRYGNQQGGGFDQHSNYQPNYGGNYGQGYSSTPPYGSYLQGNGMQGIPNNRTHTNSLASSATLNSIGRRRDDQRSGSRASDRSYEGQRSMDRRQRSLSNGRSSDGQRTLERGARSLDRRGNYNESNTEFKARGGSLGRVHNESLERN
ncbi:hypothetical protein HK098_001105 [Nowakowskiella sp. JEL0407]|nr:hypothetical protein HK098_001105 [Nowakowskiella sp. JEL0407]